MIQWWTLIPLVLLAAYTSRPETGSLSAASGTTIWGFEGYGGQTLVRPAYEAAIRQVDKEVRDSLVQAADRRLPINDGAAKSGVQPFPALERKRDGINGVKRRDKFINNGLGYHVTQPKAMYVK